MNYKQNEKINQVKESTLVVGIDIGSTTQYARAFDWRGIELGKVFTFSNSREGFEAFKAWMQHLQDKYRKSDVIVGIEPTGHYWFDLGAYLEDEGILLVMVNPYAVKQTKELDDNSQSKNDRKDPKVIAKLVTEGRYSAPYTPDGVYADLRIMVANRKRLIREMTQIKNRFARWFAIYFPEYTDVFGDYEAQSSMLLLKKVCTPEAIVELGAEKINQIWRDAKLRAENLPHDGADYFETEIKADEENEERISDFVTVYGYQYTKGSLKSGAWRNGTSGGSSTSSAKLSLNYTQDTSYNISFKASVSGGYTNGGTIGSELGVTLGASKSYSLGSGYSVTVPKGSHYLIKYRPMYYTYKVVETKYKERYNEALGGMERYVVETKTCYVDVFSHWDFTHVAK